MASRFKKINRNEIYWGGSYAYRGHIITSFSGRGWPEIWVSVTAGLRGKTRKEVAENIDKQYKDDGSK